MQACCSMAQHISAHCISVGSSYGVLLKFCYQIVIIYKQKKCFEETTSTQACSHALVDPNTPVLCEDCKIHFNTPNTFVILAIRTTVVTVLVFFLKPTDSLFWP